jgi:hypothetical protein
MAEAPFEVVGWLLQQLKVGSAGDWIVVLTSDHSARLAAQLLSARFPVALNVVLGMTNLTSTPTDVGIAGKWCRDEVAPAITQADGLAAVDWIQTGLHAPYSPWWSVQTSGAPEDVLRFSGCVHTWTFIQAHVRVLSEHFLMTVRATGRFACT